MMNIVSTLEIPRDILDSARINERDIKLELALSLYSQGRLSIGKARELAQMSLWEFRQILGFRHIPPHYDQNELEQDLTTLRELGRL